MTTPTSPTPPPETDGDAHRVPVTPVTPAAAVAIAKRSSTPTWVNVALFVALALAVGGVAFAVGRMTAPAPTFPGGGGLAGQGQIPGGAPDAGQGGQGGPGGQGGGPGFVGLGGFGGLAIDGTVTAVDADSITIETEDGETQEIALDDATTVRVAESGDLGAVTVGSSVEIGVALDPGAVRQGGGTPTLTADDVTVVP